MQLTIHTAESAPAASRPVLHDINADLGFVPNLAAAIAESPVLLGVAEEEIAAMREGTPPIDKRQAAVYEFARELVANRGSASVENLSAAGATTAEILDLVAECVFASLVGLVDNLGRVRLDGFFQARTWAGPA